MENTTRIITAWELYEGGMPKTHIAKHLGKHRETVHLWIKGIEEIGLNKYLENYMNAKKGKRRKRQLDPVLKRRIWDIRENENECCGQKIQYYLRERYGYKIAVSTIYIALHEKYVIRSKWKKNQPRGHVPEATKPREVVQMDAVDFGELFAFTGVDIFTREVDVYLAPRLTAEYGYRFLRRSMPRRFNSYSEMIQTDGGSEFKDRFKQNVTSYCKRHRIARPYKKNEQSFIESFNRTLRKECLGWKRYKQDDLKSCNMRVERFLYKYHNTRPHMSLGMKPPLVFKRDCRIFN
ncbi:MAG: integrase core domain-containing protein [Candidatus Dojkabacteria bacterium]